MKQEMEIRNSVDGEGNPAGGFVKAVGLNINWQDGPLGRGPDRREPNGAFVETVIAAAISRLDFYQSSSFACDENESAREHLRTALSHLESRTRRRESEGVEGTHAGR